MRLYTVLTALHLLSEGFPGVVFGDTFTVTEGEDVTVNCTFTFSGRTKIFCKNDCDTKDILVSTTKNSDRNGRYSIRYFKGILDNKMSVSIEKVQLSDAGRYQCKLGRRLIFDGDEEFEIKVIKAPPPVNPPVTAPKTTVTPTHSPGPDVDPGPGPSPDPSPGPSPGSGETSGTSAPLVESHTSTASGSLLFVGLTLTVIVVAFSATLLILYKKKKKSNKNKPKDFSINTEPAVSEVNREYEEIPEQQVQSRSTSDIYTLASAPAQTQVDTVLYSEVTFQGKSAPRSQTEEVIYSTVRKEEALYAKVSKKQQS